MKFTRRGFLAGLAGIGLAFPFTRVRKPEDKESVTIRLSADGANWIVEGHTIEHVDSMPHEVKIVSNTIALPVGHYAVNGVEVYKLDEHGFKRAS